MNKITQGVYNAIHRLVLSLQRFPESILLITAAMMTLIYQNHLEGQNSDISERLARIALVLVMGFFLFLCIRLLSELGIVKKLALRIALSIGGIGWLVLYYFELLPNMKTIPSVRYAAIVFAIGLVFLLLPYIKRLKGFEMYIVRLFTNLFISYLYAFVLFAGISAIIFTVNQLFNMEIEGKVYLDILIISLGIFAPTYFLSSISAVGEEIPEESFSKVLRILFLYIVMPILAIYTGILYVYFAKVLITRVWPIGMVSNLVLWYSMITVLIIFVIKPMTGGNSWAVRFSQVMPVAILPLLGMCFFAIGVRIYNYGVTESRYYVVVSALWVFGVMLYWIISKKKNNVILPITLAIIAILTIVGPQSAFSISFNSQKNRVEKILNKNNMLQGGLISKAPDKISNDDKAEIQSILNYVGNTHGYKNLKFLPANFTSSDSEKILGFELNKNDMYKNQKYFAFHLENDEILEVKGYSYLLHLYNKAEKTSKISAGEYDVEYDVANQTIKINKQKQLVYEKKLKDFADKIILNNKASKNSLSVDEMTFTDKQGAVEVKFVLRSISIAVNSDTSSTINHIDFTLLIK